MSLLLLNPWDSNAQFYPLFVSYFYYQLEMKGLPLFKQDINNGIFLMIFIQPEKCYLRLTLWYFHDHRISYLLNCDPLKNSFSLNVYENNREMMLPYI